MSGIPVMIRPLRRNYFLMCKRKIFSFLRKLNPFYKEPLPVKIIPPFKPFIQFIPTNNFSSRKKQPILAIILHHTGSLEIEKALEWFNSEVSHASTHYLIDRNGKIIQLVKNENCAWHIPPILSFQNKNRLINVSLSIHLVGDGIIPFTEEQNKSLSQLCKYLIHIYHLSPHSVFTHAFFEPAKNDPSPFDLKKFIFNLSKNS